MHSMLRRQIILFALLTVIGCGILRLPAFAETTDRNIRLNDYYRVVSAISDSYFQNDSEGIINALSDQQALFSGDQSSSTTNINEANYWLAAAHFFRLIGNRLEHEKSLKNAHLIAQKINNPWETQIILAHASLEAAEMSILAGRPSDANSHLSAIPESLTNSSIQIEARVFSAKAAASILSLNLREAFFQSAKAIDLFAKIEGHTSQHMRARVRHLAAMQRMGAPETDIALEKFVNEFVTSDPTRPLLLAEIFHVVGLQPFGENEAAQNANIFLQIVQSAELEQTHPLNFSATLALIGSDLFIGRNGDALRKSLAFLQIHRSNEPPPSTMTADLFMQMASSLSLQGESIEAHRLAQTALDISERVAGKQSVFHRLKQVDAAEISASHEFRDTALSLLRDAGVSDLGNASGLGNAIVLTRAAQVFEIVGEDQLAFEHFHQAYAALPDDPPASVINFAVVEPYSELLFRNGDHKEALRVTRHAVAMLREIVAQEKGLMGQLQFDPLQSQRIRAFRKGNAPVLDRLLDLLASIPSNEMSLAMRNEAFGAAQFANGSKIEDTLSKIAERKAIDSPVLTNLLRRKQDLNFQLANAREELTFLEAGLTEPAPAANTIDDVRSNLFELRNDLLLLDEQIQDQFPKASAAASLPILDIEQIQSSLDEDEAVLVFHQTDARTLLWTITKDGDSFKDLNVSPEEVTSIVTALRKMLNPEKFTRGFEVEQGLGENSALFDRQLAYHLFRALLGPVWAEIREKGTLYFSANRSLTSIPFSLLITQLPTGSDASTADLQASSWLLKSHATVTLPSISYLKVFASDRAQSDLSPSIAPRLIAFGDPQFSQRPTEAKNAERTSIIRRLHKLAPLPNTKRELAAIANLLNSDTEQLYLGRRATEANLKTANLIDADIIAFATHALLSSEISGLNEPAIVLTPPEFGSDLDDGLVTASELSLLRIDADWIIFSACNTAGPDGSTDGESLSGLASAALFAGARSLLVSHWPVADDTTADLTVKTLAAFYGVERTDKAQALRLAMLEILMDPKRPAHAHPAFWAPFILVGGLQR